MKILRIVIAPLLIVSLAIIFQGEAFAAHRKVSAVKTIVSKLAAGKSDNSSAKHKSLLKDIPPSPNFNNVCPQLSQKASTACIAAVLAAVNNAHKKTGIPVIDVNINSLAKMNGPESLLVLVNLERISRGLQPFSGLTKLFDQVARKAAEGKTDPGLSNEEMLLGSNGYVANWGGNWAENIESPLEASYDFVYQDGPGAFNVLCTPQNKSGCYGHRENILGSYPYEKSACGGLKPQLLMGASVLNHHPAAHNPASMTELFVGVCVRHPISPYIKWSTLEKELQIGNSLLQN